MPSSQYFKDALNNTKEFLNDKFPRLEQLIDEMHADLVGKGPIEQPLYAGLVSGLSFGPADFGNKSPMIMKNPGMSRPEDGRYT